MNIYEALIIISPAKAMEIPLELSLSIETRNVQNQYRRLAKRKSALRQLWKAKAHIRLRI